MPPEYLVFAAPSAFLCIFRNKTFCHFYSPLSGFGFILCIKLDRMIHLIKGPTGRLSAPEEPSNFWPETPTCRWNCRTVPSRWIKSCFRSLDCCLEMLSVPTWMMSILAWLDIQDLISYFYNSGALEGKFMSSPHPLFLFNKECVKWAEPVFYQVHGQSTLYNSHITEC